MRPRDLAPNATVMAAVLLHLGLVYVRQALTSVPGHLFLSVHILDLNQRRAGVLIRLGPLVSKNSSSHIESDALSLAALHHFRMSYVPLVLLIGFLTTS